MRTFNIFSLLTLLVLLTAAPALALSDSQQKEFDRIMNLSMADLTGEASELLEKKYPDEDWDQWKFPQYVFTNESVEVGYMIAVKQPRLIEKFNCYCFCDAMGHKSLLDCFVKKGFFGQKYDDHAAGCNICYGQAMMAFLWAEIGATDDTIKAGFDKKFARLLQQQQQK